MMRPGVLFSLTAAQGIYAGVSLALFSYGIHSSAVKSHIPGAFVAGLGASLLSVIALSYKAMTWRSISQGVNLYWVFISDAIHCLLHMATFVWLVVLVMRQKECEAVGCAVVKAATAIKGFEYSVWAATSTLLGIEISKKRMVARTYAAEKLAAHT